MRSGDGTSRWGRRGPARTLLWQLVREQRGYLSAAIGISAVAFIVQIALGQAAVAVIDKGVQERTEALGPLTLRMGALGVTHITLAILGVLLMTRVRWHIEYRVRTVLHRSLVAEEVADHDLATGQVVTRSVADLGQLNNVVYLVPVFVAGVPAVLSGMAYLGYLNFPLMVVTFASIPVNFWLVRRLRARVQALSWLQLQETGEVTRAIDEPIRGIRVVKLFGTEEAVLGHVRHAARQAYRYAVTRGRLLALYSAILTLTPALTQAALLFLGARLIAGGSLTSGKFLVFFVGSGQVVYFAQSFSAILDGWSFAKVGSSRLGELVDPEGTGVGDRMVEGDRAEVAADPFGPPTIGWACHDLVLDDGNELCEPLTFAVAPGEAVLVQGPASLSLYAVAEVCTGDFAPHRGRVWLEDVPLDELPTTEARSQLRILDSEPYLFARTVRENLLLGAGLEGADPAEVDRRIERALWAACADEVVATLPAGLDEVLGDRAMNLSGGQRQRLAVARALLSEPRVLLLVEALSGVHAAMEAEIVRRVREAAPHTAILYLTARPSSADTVDRVVTIALSGAASTAAAAAAAPTAAGRPDPSAVPADLLAVFEASDEVPRCDDGAEADEREPTVANLGRPFRRLILALTPVVIVLTGLSLAPQYLFGVVNDAIEAGSTSAETDRYAAMLLGLILLAALGQWWFDANTARLSNGMLYLLRTRLVRRLTRLGLAYYDRELPGYVATRVLHDLDEITGFARAVATRLVVTALTLVAATVAMALVGTQVLLLIVGVVASAVVVTVIQVPIARRAYLRQRAALGDVIARLEEDYNGRGAIAEADALGHATGQFDELALRLRHADRWSACVAAGYQTAIQWILEIGGALIMWRSGELVLAGSLSLGAMLMVRLFLTKALLPVQELGNLWQQYLRAGVSFDRLRQPYQAAILPVDRADAVACTGLAGDIELADVHFRYPGTDREVLDGTSLVIPEGATVAVMGPTGAGKSTIGKLVTRVYDPDRGTVTVGGRDLREFTTASLRHHIGVVPQEPFLFAGTVAGNIAYGRPTASRAEVAAAADAVGASAVIDRLPAGLDAPVVEEGINLTPQQRQLVALARAWLVQPDILVLDEATSALDDRTERRVLDALRDRAGTTIFVTHREAVAAAADLLLTVDGGVDLAPAPVPVPSPATAAARPA